MAISALDSIIAKTSSSSAATAASDAAATSDRFLKLLVAQMQNQDPLNPMDNAQVTTQMAQINTVSGIDKLNTTVQGLQGQFVQMQALQGASLVGRDVVVAGKKLDIADGVGQGGFELATPADAVKVELLSSAGQVLDTLNLGAQPSGLNGFSWPAGTKTNDDNLTFRITATKGAADVAVTTLMRDKVTAVSTSGTSLNLELENSGTVAYTDVKAFN
jgi:flagellar basal-body rod modification protein FlgD